MSYRRGDLPIKVLRFDEIAVGQEAEHIHELTEQDVQAFASLTGDFNPLHMDEEFARRTMFCKPVVHGMISASFISTLIGTMLPGAGALWSSQTLEFVNPARVGDVLRIIVRVKQKSEATRTIVLDVRITKQDGQTVVSGESIVKALEIREERTTTVKESAGLTVLVTGGSRGIGAAIVEKLATDGHSVVLNYVQSAQEAGRIVHSITDRGHRAISVCGDISQRCEVERVFAAAVDAFGPVHAVVHCAGSSSLLRPFEELDWEAFERQLDIHLKGAFHCAKAALPQMVETQAGAFVFLGSIAADGVPPLHQADYVVAKSALAALTRCLALEYGPKGVRVNTIAPGITLTDMVAGLPEKAKLLARMQTPLRRLAEPADIAAVAAFLLSPGARHITGETLRVCGGAVMA